MVRFNFLKYSVVSLSIVRVHGLFDLTQYIALSAILGERVGAPRGEKATFQRASYARISASVRLLRCQACGCLFRGLSFLIE